MAWDVDEIGNVINRRLIYFPLMVVGRLTEDKHTYIAVHIPIFIKINVALSKVIVRYKKHGRFLVRALSVSCSDYLVGRRNRSVA